MYDLYIANKNYSSWSLRPWVLLKANGIPFAEHLIPFHDADAWQDYRQQAPNGLVPMLWDGDLRVWDSLAIAEYLAERHEGIWPADPAARAFARCATAEMHAGFSTLRNICGMNVGIRVELSQQSKDRLTKDLARLTELWTEGLDRFGGPWLAGDKFSAADAFFCPVAFRIQTYGIALDEQAQAYVQHLLDHPAMQEWYAAGIAEDFRDWPHEKEIGDAGTLVEDVRAPATNAPTQKEA